MREPTVHLMIPRSDNRAPAAAPSTALSIATRWADFDANGHANNAVFFTYLEAARDHLFVTAGIRRDRTVLVRVELDYRRPIPLGTGHVEVTVACKGVGRTSIRTLEEIKLGGTVCACAASISVLVDERGKPLPVPASVRQKLGQEEVVSACLSDALPAA